MYVGVMFPYPSGSGLHIGHAYNYAIMDSYCNWLRYKGLKVFQPFGYDSFGLPAENYARQIGGDPRIITYQNIENFRNQMSHMRTSFDERLITSDPSYFKWTQWIFTKLHEHGLAYKKDGEVNWCNECGTVIANEQVNNGNCDRHGIAIERRVMNQWYFRITDYRDRLIKGLDTVDYPKSTIKQQKDWLEKLHDWCVSRQRKWGCPIPIEGETDTLDTFVDSSFYYLRYLTNSETEFLPSSDFRQMDLYVGGPEHACQHLIYARFIHYFLYDIGIVPTEEPFKKVIHQGMIIKDGAKMSKSKGNVVNPLEYEPSDLRMYLMFIGHYFDGGEWSDQHIQGIRKFIKRMKVWLSQIGNDELDLTKLKTEIDANVLNFKFNKVISGLMTFYNQNKNKILTTGTIQEITDIMEIFAPTFRNYGE